MDMPILQSQYLPMKYLYISMVYDYSILVYRVVPNIYVLQVGIVQLNRVENRVGIEYAFESFYYNFIKHEIICIQFLSQLRSSFKG